MKGTPQVLGITSCHKDWQKLLDSFRNDETAYQNIYINKYADFQNSPCVEIASEMFLISLENISEKYNHEYVIDASIKIKPDGSAVSKIYDVYINKTDGGVVPDDIRKQICEDIRIAGQNALKNYSKIVRAMWDTDDELVGNMLAEVELIVNEKYDILAYELDGKVHNIIGD